MATPDAAWLYESNPDGPIAQELRLYRYCDKPGWTEIARQAAIFASAKWACIWFNQVPSWNGLRAAIDWMSLKYLKESEGDRFGDTVFDVHLDDRASEPTGLVKRQGSSDASNNFFENDGWFTSLWTLQEACMRPDLFLCNKQWEPLRTRKAAHAITLDHLIALFNCWIGEKDTKVSPWGVREVETILGRTAMHKLLDMCPIDILVFGDQRYCEDDQRAKAIMSALGVTDWYIRQQASSTVPSSGQPGTPLIESRYPFAFINDVRERFGAVFFSTANYTPIPDRKFRLSRWNRRIVNTSLFGTMLPFAIDGLRRRIFSYMRAPGVEDHPSVRTWVLRPDGSITIPQAGIIASWPPPPSRSGRGPESLQCIITARSAGLETRPLSESELYQWFASFRPKYEKHAVCLARRNERFCIGILIERVYMTDGVQDFIKIGTFWFITGQTSGHARGVYQFPQTTDVSWRVL